MKKNKRVLKLVEKCVGVCCREGKVNAQKASRTLKLLKSFSTDRAIFAISEFLKGIKKQKDQYLLVVESNTKLSQTEINKFAKILKKDHIFSEVRNVVNPSLLGGLRIKIGDNIHDYSLKGKIAQLGGAIHG